MLSALPAMPARQKNTAVGYPAKFKFVQTYPAYSSEIRWSDWNIVFDDFKYGSVHLTPVESTIPDIDT